MTPFNAIQKSSTMKTILVSLVSDQTIPNILAIHCFNPDALLFLTTIEMEKKKKVSAITETLKKLNLPYDDTNTSCITILEDSILDCHQKLDEWIKGKEKANFVINLTCGTKIMSIAAYDYFKDYQSEMLYIPIPNNHYIIPFPKKLPHEPVELTLRLRVIDYVTAYGLKVVNENRLGVHQEAAAAREEKTLWLAHHYNSLAEMLTWLWTALRPHRNEQEYCLNEKRVASPEDEKEFFKKFSFSVQQDTVSKKLTRSEIIYFTGGWLEEFCFNELLKYKGKCIDDAVLGIELQNQQNGTNEFDMMFTRDNALYYVECKSLTQQNDKDADVLYKIGALQREFGLKVESFLVSTSPHILKGDELKPSIKARAEQFNTTVIKRDEFVNCAAIITEKIEKCTM